MHLSIKKITLLLAVVTVSILFTNETKKQNTPIGQVVYEKNCLSCHQADGSGVPGMNPPLAGVSWVTGNKEKLITIVLKGINTPLEIAGELYHNPMPSHQHLTDKEIAYVLSYIRSTFGNKASAVSEEEVRKVRSKKCAKLN
jgi:mono/diheme cytochrome c family protein